MYGNSAQMGDRGRRQRVHQRVHLLGGVGAAQREAQAGARAVGRKSQGGEHVRRRDGAAEEQAEPVETAKPRRSSAITMASPSTPSKQMLLVLGVRFQREPLMPVPEMRPSTAFSRRSRSAASRSDSAASVAFGQFAGGAEGRDTGHVLGAGTAVALVMAAESGGREPGSLAHVERAHALGSVELVAAHAVKVDPERLHIDRDFAERLHAVHVQRNAGLAGDARNLGDGLHGAQLVVGVHDGDQHGIGRRARRTSSGSTVPPAPTGRRVTATPSRSSWAQGPSTAGCSMALVMTCLGRAGGHAARTTPKHRQVVGLGAAAGEDHFGRVGVDERRNLPAGGFQLLLGGLAEMVDAGSVTIHLTETRHQRLQNFGSDGSGGVVVEIEMLHLPLFYQCPPILTLTTDFGLSDHYVGA
jgi:hypothetical protein